MWKLVQLVIQDGYQFCKDSRKGKQNTGSKHCEVQLLLPSIFPFSPALSQKMSHRAQTCSVSEDGLTGYKQSLSEEHNTSGSLSFLDLGFNEVLFPLELLFQCMVHAALVIFGYNCFSSHLLNCPLQVRVLWPALAETQMPKLSLESLLPELVLLFLVAPFPSQVRTVMPFSADNWECCHEFKT